MFPDVVHVRHTCDCRLELTFADGVVKELEFRELVVGHGEIFEPLEDISYFKQVRVTEREGDE